VLFFPETSFILPYCLTDGKTFYFISFYFNKFISFKNYFDVKTILAFFSLNVSKDYHTNLS